MTAESRTPGPDDTRVSACTHSDDSDDSWLDQLESEVQNLTLTSTDNDATTGSGSSPLQDLQIDAIVESVRSRLKRGRFVNRDRLQNRFAYLQPRLGRILESVAFVQQTIRHSGAPESDAEFPDIPDYDILGRLGAGGMGIVYLARQQRLDREVALKLIPEALLSRELAVRRFELEARAAASLSHPNIVSVYDVGHAAGRHYFTMERIRGCGLDHVINRLRISRQQRDADATQHASGDVSKIVRDELQTSDDATTETAESTDHRLPKRFDLQVARIGRDVASALFHAHERGVLHRDIKPSNLMLDATGKVWVTDFGLAKTDESDLTRSGDLVGTMRFLAPERLEGLCDRRSDLYSLGITLFELATLQPAYGGRDAASILSKIRDTDPPRPASINSNLPRDLETIIAKLIRRDPAERYQTAAEAQADLDRFLEGRPILARPSSVASRTWSWAKRNRALASSLAAAALLLCVIAVGASYAAIRFRNDANTQSRLRREADREGQRANKIAIENERNLYAAEMRLASDASSRPSGWMSLRDRVDRWKDSKNVDRGFEFKLLRQLAEQPRWQIQPHRDVRRVTSTTLTPDRQGLWVVDRRGPQRLSMVDASESTRSLDKALPAVTAKPSGPSRTPSKLAYSASGKWLARLIVGLGIEVQNAADGKVHWLYPADAVIDFDWVGSGDQLALIARDGNRDEAPGHLLRFLNVAKKQVSQTIRLNPLLGKMSMGRMVFAHPGGDWLVIPVSQSGGPPLRFACLWFHRNTSRKEVDKARKTRPPWNLVGRTATVGSPVVTASWAPREPRLLALTYDAKIHRFDLRINDAESSVLVDQITQTPPIANRSVHWFDDETILLGGLNGSLYTIDACTLERVSHFYGHGGPVLWCHGDPAGGFIDAYSGANTWIRHAPSERTFQGIRLPGVVNNLAYGMLTWSRDSRYLVAAKGTQPLAWDTRTGRVAIENEVVLATKQTLGREVESLHDASLRERFSQHKFIAFPPRYDAARRFCAAAYRPANQADSPHRSILEVVSCDGETKTLCRLGVKQRFLDAAIWSPAPPAPSDTSDPSARPISSAPARLAACDISMNVRVIDLPAPPQLNAISSQLNAISPRIIRHDSDVKTIDWHPDGTRLATGTDDGVIRLWETTQFQCVFEYRLGYLIDRLRFSPDGKSLGVLTNSNHAIVFHVRDDAARDDAARDDKTGHP
ncbi:MAG: WD40 repeat domain-containing serine/threonine protein kinase [Planctomycetota bacterium]